MHTAKDDLDHWISCHSGVINKDDANYLRSIFDDQNKEAHPCAERPPQDTAKAGRKERAFMFRSEFKKQESMLESEHIGGNVVKAKYHVGFLDGMRFAAMSELFGPPDVQQLKPKMPLLEEVQQMYIAHIGDGERVTTVELGVVEWVHDYISRHFGH